MPPAPQPRTPSPLTIVVWESVPTRVSGNANTWPSMSRVATTVARYKIHLMHDTGPRGNYAELIEGLLGPAKQGITLMIALIFAFDIAFESQGRAECIDLNGMVDHQVDWHQRIDLLWIAAHSSHGQRMAARSTTVGTPVKSCKMTRAADRGTRTRQAALGLQEANCRTIVSSFSSAAHCRRTFSSRLDGDRQTGKCLSGTFQCGQSVVCVLLSSRGNIARAPSLDSAHLTNYSCRFPFMNL